MGSWLVCEGRWKERRIGEGKGRGKRREEDGGMGGDEMMSAYTGAAFSQGGKEG